MKTKFLLIISITLLTSLNLFAQTNNNESKPELKNEINNIFEEEMSKFKSAKKTMESQKEEIDNIVKNNTSKLEQNNINIIKNNTLQTLPNYPNVRNEDISSFNKSSINQYENNNIKIIF